MAETLAAMRRSYDAQKTELRAIADKEPDLVTAADETRFERLMKSVQFLGVEIADAESRSGASAHRRTRGMGVRDDALDILETRGRDLAPRQLDHVDHLLRTQTQDCHGSRIAERMVLTENPDYHSGFMKGITDPSPVWTPEESRAINAFRDFEKTETRAASEGTGSAGGFGIPVLIDPTIILTSGALDAPILSVARVVTITTDAWHGVTAPGAAWSYTAEAGVVTDGTPTFTQPTIPVYKATGFIPYSMEIGQDYPGFAAEMSMVLNQGYIDLVAQQSMTGSGSSSPTGIFTALAATTASQLAVTTTGALGGIDVRTLWGKLPERFRPRATWLMSPTTMAIIRGLGNNLALADFTVNLLQDGTQMLTGKPVIETDYAPGFTGTTGVENYLVVGDFSNFVFVNRTGTNIELIQNLFDPTTARPTGERGWLAYSRHGFAPVNLNAFRVLVNGPIGVGA
jgi:HK97 family phage major capsid protein